MSPLNPPSCAHCATPIRAGRRRDARYCDQQCRNAVRGATAGKRPAIPADRPLFRVRNAAELAAAALELVGAYDRRDRAAVLGMEAQLLEGEVSDMLAALVQLVQITRATSSQISPT